MVAVKQSRETLQLDAPLSGLEIAYDGMPRIDAASHQEAVDGAYRKGYDEASMHYNQQILDFRSEVNVLREGTFTALEDRFSSLLGEAREALMTLTYDCVCRVLGGLEMSSEVVFSIVNSVIEESGLDEEKMEIRLSPQDIALLEEFEAELKSKHPRLQFVADKTLKRGDCLLSSRFGKVDGMMSTKLDRLKDGLRPQE